jgi:hypothetical protein
MFYYYFFFYLRHPLLLRRHRYAICMKSDTKIIPVRDRVLKKHIFQLEIFLTYLQLISVLTNTVFENVG